MSFHLSFVVIHLSFVVIHFSFTYIFFARVLFLTRVFKSFHLSFVVIHLSFVVTRLSFIYIFFARVLFLTRVFLTTIILGYFNDTSHCLHDIDADFVRAIPWYITCRAWVRTIPLVSNTHHRASHWSIAKYNADHRNSPQQ